MVYVLASLLFRMQPALGAWSVAQDTRTVGLAQDQTTYPEKSIGGLVKSLNDLLSQPQSRHISHLYSPSVRSGGVIYEGPNFSDWDTYRVEVKSDGHTIRLVETNNTQLYGRGKVTQTNKSEYPDLDPEAFGVISLSEAFELFPGESGTNLVLVKTTGPLRVLLGSTKVQRDVPAGWFGLGFVNLDDAKVAKKILEDIKKRAEFEKEVKKLPDLTNFGERSTLYEKLHQELWKQGTKIGFFEAASSTTLVFSYGLINTQQFQGYLRSVSSVATQYGASDASSLIDLASSLSEPIAFSNDTAQFLESLSRGLARLNKDKALQLLRFGALEPSTSVSSDFVSVDHKMVDAEQDYAERQIAALGASKEGVVANINKVFGISLDNALKRFVASRFFVALRASVQVRQEKKAQSNSDFDYGNIEERKRIGLLATEIVRKRGG